MHRKTDRERDRTPMLMKLKEVQATQEDKFMNTKPDHAQVKVKAQQRRKARKKTDGQKLHLNIHNLSNDSYYLPLAFS